MKRLIASSAIFVVAACGGLAGHIGIANAAPANITSITLSCDKNVNADVTLTLQPSATDTTSLGDVDIACGPNSNLGRQRNRVEVPTGQLAAGWVTITAWTNSPNTGTNDCTNAGPTPYKADCTNSARTGSQLVVR